MKIIFDEPVKGARKVGEFRGAEHAESVLLESLASLGYKALTVDVKGGGLRENIRGHIGGVVAKSGLSDGD